MMVVAWSQPMLNPITTRDPRKTALPCGGTARQRHVALRWKVGPPAAASTFPGTTTEVPGNQFAYAYDDIGNRKEVSMGDSTNGIYKPMYAANLLNQYTQRDISHNIEVSGYSEAPDVEVNGSTATRFYDTQTPPRLKYDGFFHKRLTDSNTNDPEKVPVSVEEVPGNFTDFEVFLPAKPEAFTYDADGNLASDGIWTYAWDAENRLVAMQLKESIGNILLERSDLWLRLEFAYDAMGRRISKRVMRSSDALSKFKDPSGATYQWDASSWTKFVYDVGSWNLSAALTCDPEWGGILGANQTFAWGPDLSGTENGAGGIGGLAVYFDDWNDGGGGSGAIGAMFPAYDGNGNVLRLFDGSADSAGVPARLAGYQYGPFGEDRGRTGPREASRFPFRWSTKYTDNETGLVDYGYRYYSAGLGRWTNRDSLQERGGLAVYASFVNSPTNAIDPDGRQVVVTALKFGWEAINAAFTLKSISDLFNGSPNPLKLAIGNSVTETVSTKYIGIDGTLDELFPFGGRTRLVYDNGDELYVTTIKDLVYEVLFEARSAGYFSDDNLGKDRGSTQDKGATRATARAHVNGTTTVTIKCLAARKINFTWQSGQSAEATTPWTTFNIDMRWKIQVTGLEYAWVGEPHWGNGPWAPPRPIPPGPWNHGGNPQVETAADGGWQRLLNLQCGCN
jgi:RHS repeat-associated protein